MMDIIINDDSEYKCSKCNNDNKYSIYVGENPYGRYCDEHLKQGVDNAIKYRNTHQKIIDNIKEKDELEKAIKLITKKSINVMKLIREKKIERINKK